MNALGWTITVLAVLGFASAGLGQPKDSPEELVRQLDSKEYAKREAAEAAIIELGAKSLPAVRAGTKNPSAEVASRCERLFERIRKSELASFRKAFKVDTARTARFDHPLWKHFADVAGDSRPSRELFGHILENADWAEALDGAEAHPRNTGELYRAALRDIGHRYQTNMLVSFLIPVWPCDQPEEVAFLFLLGSYPDADPAYPLTYGLQEDQRFSDGEGRLFHGRGLGLALRGRRLAADPKRADMSIEVDDKAGDAAESGRTMLRLLGNWLVQRNLWSVVSEHLRALNADQQKQLLLFARRAVANAKAPALCRAAWIAVLRRFGDASDADRLAGLFGEKDGMDWPGTTRFGEGPGNVINQAQVREVAIGSAIFLRGRHPADFGFTGLASDRAAKRREDEIPSMLFTVMPVGTNAQKDEVLAKAVQWLEAQAGKR
jgi:hypothetical protein